MKKVMTVLSAAVLAAGLVGCSAKNTDDQIIGGDSATWGPELEEENDVEIPSPMTEVSTKEEAEQKAGFTIDAPTTIDGYTTTYFVYDLEEGYMIEIRFENEEDAITIRKQAGNGNDISGDYNVYAETAEVIINDKTVTENGNNGVVNKTTWTDGSYDYAISSEAGMSVDAVTELVNQIG